MTDLNSAQITQLAEEAGWPPDEIQNLLGVIGSESSGNADVVAWGNGPNVLADSLGWPPPTGAAGYDEAAVGLTQELLSPASAVTPGAIEQLQNPEYNLQIALQKFSESGWHPWEGDAYITAHPELLTQSGSGGTGVPVSPSTGVSGKSTGFSLASATPPVTSTDVFTNMMIQLDKLMNPNTGGISGFLGLFTGGTEASVLGLIFVRGTFTAAFGVLGIASLLGLVSGGRLGGKDIPGIAAGFLAGPEVGLANLGRRFGVNLPSGGTNDSAENLELRRQRLQIQQARESRAASAAPAREQRAQEAATRAQQSLEFRQQQESRRNRRTRPSKFQQERASRSERRLQLDLERERRLQSQMFTIDE